jgi:dolichyl-phosphate beta-glucosyltransferase
MKKNGVYLSIVIPAYNEEKRIRRTLENTMEFLKGKEYSYEIMVVDDGSTDGTRREVLEIGGGNKNVKVIGGGVNHGKGYAVAKGAQESSGEYVYFTDADMSTPIEEVDRFLEEMLSSGSDIVIGSRAVKNAKILQYQPLYRQLLGKLFCAFVRLSCGIKYIDTQCGAKLFRRKVVSEVFGELKINRFAFDVEILFLANRKGFKVSEMPVTWSHSNDSKVRVFTDGFKMFLDVIKLRFIHG